MTATPRLFIGLSPPDAVRQPLTQVRHHVHTRFGGRVVTTANLHLTLAFLGATPAARTTELVRLIDALAFTPLDLTLDQIGSFDRARVVWIGLSRHQVALDTLVQALRAELRAGQFPTEDHPFNAHVTLLRKATCLTEPVETIHWRADTICLYGSVSTPEGVRYDVLHRRTV